jgi:hypothetical protein
LFRITMFAFSGLTWVEVAVDWELCVVGAL